MRRGFWEIKSLQLALSHVILFPRYIDTGLVLMISRSGVSWLINQPYRGVELVMTRPSSTWTGMMRRSGLPVSGMVMDEWGGRSNDQ